MDGKPVIYYCAYLYLVGVLLFLVLKGVSVFSCSASFAVLQVFQEQSSTALVYFLRLLFNCLININL